MPTSPATPTDAPLSMEALLTGTEVLIVVSGVGVTLELPVAVVVALLMVLFRVAVVVERTCRTVIVLVVAAETVVALLSAANAPMTGNIRAAQTVEKRMLWFRGQWMLLWIARGLLRLLKDEERLYLYA